ncbi:hypothetical protein AGLY_011423, partial [Aphis glycines]
MSLHIIFTISARVEEFMNFNTYRTIVYKLLRDLVRLNFDDLSFLGIVPRSLFAVLCPLPDRFVRRPSEILCPIFGEPFPLRTGLLLAISAENVAGGCENVCLINTFGCKLIELIDILDTSSMIAVTGTDPIGGTVCKPLDRLSEFTDQCDYEVTTGHGAMKLVTGVVWTQLEVVTEGTHQQPNQNYQLVAVRNIYDLFCVPPETMDGLVRVCVTSDKDNFL